MHLSKKVFIVLGILLIFSFLSVTFIYVIWKSYYQPKETTQNDSGSVSTTLEYYSTCEEIISDFKKAQNKYSGFDLMESPTIGSTTRSNVTYSETNVQVSGVDEADIVKTNGEIVASATTGSVVITNAYPPEDARAVGKITYDDNRQIQELFLRENVLVVISTQYNTMYLHDGVESDRLGYSNSTITFLDVYDVSDESNPDLVRSIEVEGMYNTSRLIDNFGYFVLNSTPEYSILENYVSPNDIIPSLRESQNGDISDQQFEPISKCNSVAHIDPIETQTFITLVSFPIDELNGEISKEIIAGSSQNIYSSLENMYVVNTEYSYNTSPQPFFDFFGLIQSNDTEVTNIYKFDLNSGKVSFERKTTLPGRVLNQFSMDEFDGNLRIATTEGQTFDDSSTNNLFVLNSNLEEIGSIRNIANGEAIYSARFMGSRGYLVTFKKVDPFFTLDLSDPTNPRLAGELKIPGYSDYLHPYDETHIIGIGKNAVDAAQGSFAWYQGVKIALFDVSDFNNPKELYAIEVGDRGTDSYILNDHKAFLFNKEQNLLVLPILLAEIDQEDKQLNDPYMQDPASRYGTYTYQGAYVFRLTVEDGFELQSKITHFSEKELDELKDSGNYFYYEDGKSIKRSLFIGDYLYTVSDGVMKVNLLSNLSVIKEITLRDEEEITSPPVIY